MATSSQRMQSFSEMHGTFLCTRCIIDSPTQTNNERLMLPFLPSGQSCMMTGSFQIPSHSSQNASSDPMKTRTCLPPLTMPLALGGMSAPAVGWPTPLSGSWRSFFLLSASKRSCMTATSLSPQVPSLLAFLHAYFLLAINICLYLRRLLHTGAWENLSAMC